MPRFQTNDTFTPLSKKKIINRTKRLSLLKQQTKKSKQRQKSLGIVDKPVFIDEDTTRKIMNYWEQKKRKETAKMFGLYLRKYKYNDHEKTVDDFHQYLKQI